MTVKAHELRELVCFRLNGGLYAVDISMVREIVRLQQMTRVPKSPSHVLGVTNLRGHVIPVVDLRLRLGMAPREHGAQSRILVVELGTDSVGFAVDEVSGIVRLPWDVIDPVKDLGALKGSELMSGVARHGDELICLLNLLESAGESSLLEPLPVVPEWQEVAPSVDPPRARSLKKAA
ncbi:MAG: chemotaxis protein CheW [Proteobacteria bacterium]|nr:chemotaxis protein CheW [Pseudomonadota bacterium]